MTEQGCDRAEAVLLSALESLDRKRRLGRFLIVGTPEQLRELKGELRKIASADERSVA